MLLRIYFKCCAYQDMVNFRRPSNTEALICNGTQFLLSNLVPRAFPSDEVASYHDQVKERLIAIVKDHEL